MAGLTETLSLLEIESLDSDEGVGYQRLLDEKRAKRLAEYLLDAHKARL